MAMNISKLHKGGSCARGKRALTRRAFLRQIVASSLLVVLIAGVGGATCEAVSIQNDFLKADVTSGALTLTSRSTGRAFLKNAIVGTSSITVRMDAKWHPTLGQGKVVTVKEVSGNFCEISLYDGVPFALIQQFLGNEGPSTNRVVEVQLFDATVDIGVPHSRMRALGTAGLTAVDQHPGSYVFLALAEPESRKGVVGAWLTGDRGSGIVFSRLDGDKITLCAQIDYGRLLLPPRSTTPCEVFAIGYFPDARIGLEEWADLTARYNHIKLRPQIDGYCTWYSRPFGFASDEVHILELAEFAAKELHPFGLRFVQIDDRWQAGQTTNGPRKQFTDYDPLGPYANGLRPVAGRIRELGLTPGLWFMPFAGTLDDPYFADKQYLFARGTNGRPYDTPWGGTCLDLTNPRTQEYVSLIARRFVQEWGFKYFKMDGLWTGTAAAQQYINNGYKRDDLGQAAVYDSSVTPIEAYRNGLKIIRQAAGDDVFLLGCCVAQNMRSFGGSFGLVDAMRIGPDNWPTWDQMKRGPWHASNRYFLHGRVWYNDPDPVYLRDSVPLEQARALCSWVAISGSLNVCSDWLPGLPTERLDLLKRILPHHQLMARPVDIFETDLANVWILSDSRSKPERHVVGLFNWSEEDTLHVKYPVARLGLESKLTYAAFDYWSNKFLPVVSRELQCDVPPASCRVIALRALGQNPVVVSTSRHVTQGIVDLASETWTRGEMKGRSYVVAGDPYELRLAVPGSKGRFRRVADAAVQGLSRSAVTVHQEGATVRIKFIPVATGEVSWSLKFKEH